MTDSNPRRSLAEARTLAQDFVDLVGPACSRIEIAGSVRRLQQEVGDIEIVCEPWHENAQDLHGRLVKAENDGLVKLDRKSSDGKRAPFGPRYYRLTYKGFPLDLFVVLPPADFGVIFTLRTGSRDFSHWLATRALQVNRRIRDGHLEKQRYTLDSAAAPYWERIPCSTEQDFFQALGVKWVGPELRKPGIELYVKAVA